jgi:segregation and condensation protein B
MAGDGPSGLELLDVVEAALFVGARPLSEADVVEACPSVAQSDVRSALRELRRRYRRQRRPYTVARRGEGYVLELIEPHRSEILERVRRRHAVKLNRTAVEVLSVVAYRQPIAKADVEELLGMDAGGPLRQLVRRGLVALEAANDGSPARYVTTPRFLEVFSLDSLADLPSSQDLEHC